MQSRPYSAAADLRRMQDLVSEAWRLEGPKVERHIGDVAWADASIAGREPEWRRQLWEEGGAVIAWGWLYLPHTLDFQVHPERRGLVDDVLDWFEAEAEGDEPLVTSALAEDTATIAALERRGYVRVEGGPWFAYMIRDLGELPEPGVPDGFALRAVRGEGDVEARANVHRAAWHPSRVTAESHRKVMATYPYRAELDCVVEAPDGSFVSSVIAWYDEANHVGEFEPVGTDPRFRRLGLGRAGNLFALHRLRQAGAETAIVLCRGDDEYPIPKRLYESVGFRQHARGIEFRKSRI